MELWLEIRNAQTGKELKIPFSPRVPDEKIMETYHFSYPIAYFTNEEGKRLLDMPFPPELYFGRLRDRFAYGRWNACLANLFGQCYVNGGHLEKGRKLLVVKAAVGGSGFTKEQWTEGGDCSNKMFHMVKEALKLSNDMRIVAFLWHQGEADAFDLPERSPEVRHAKYVENFGNFVDRVRKAYGHGFPIICGEFTRTWIAKNQIACNAVLTAMQKVVDRDGFAEIVSSEGLIPNGVKIGTTDILHFSRDALHRFGIRYY